jgi:hypothetical protein
LPAALLHACFPHCLFILIASSPLLHAAILTISFPVLPAAFLIGYDGRMPHDNEQGPKKLLINFLEGNLGRVVVTFIPAESLNPHKSIKRNMYVG